MALTVMPLRIYVFSLAVCAKALSAQPVPCTASPEILTEFQEAATASAAVTDSFGALKKAEPFRALCYRHPDDLFVHERYQDAMHENGIEGHLQLLTKQYKTLEDKHPGEPMYHYLWLRTTVGRSTLEAIKSLNEILEAHPDFAPAHRTLAGIYGAEAFRDPRRERSEKEKYLALCPGGTLTKRPPSVPAVTPLLEQAERLLAAGGEPDRIIEMTNQGLMELEWRSQRIRAFDWYSADYKRQDARELRARYWQAWPIQVRCHRKAGRTEQANQLLAYMAKRAAGLRNQPGPAYQEAADTLARLNAEATQPRPAAALLPEQQKQEQANPQRR
jgi:hypothetical protein